MDFRLLGFPVSIQNSFLLTIVFFGFISFQNLPTEDLLVRVVAFTVIAVASVLIHEFGHAFAARSQGTVGTPAISLAGMAGLTRYRLEKIPSRAQSIFISFAGPLTGLVLGAIIFGVRQAGIIEETRLIRDLFRIGLFTTFGWSIFNLVPVVPLDGGHIMTDLLPGNLLQRRRRAAWVSIAFALTAAVVLFFIFGFDFLIAQLILAGMAWQNYSGLKDLPAVAHPTPN